MLKKRHYPKKFVADHPFYISLQHNTDEIHLVLFAGSVRSLEASLHQESGADVKSARILATNRSTSPDWGDLEPESSCKPLNCGLE